MRRRATDNVVCAVTFGGRGGDLPLEHLDVGVRRGRLELGADDGRRRNGGAVRRRRRTHRAQIWSGK